MGGWDAVLDQAGHAGPDITGAGRATAPRPGSRGGAVGVDPGRSRWGDGAVVSLAVTVHAGCDIVRTVGWPWIVVVVAAVQTVGITVALAVSWWMDRRRVARTPTRSG